MDQATLGPRLIDLHSSRISPKAMGGQELVGLDMRYEDKVRFG